MRTSLLFFKRNYKKYKSIMLSIVMFLLLINIMVGFVLSITGNFKSDVVNNKKLYFMEVKTDKDISILTEKLVSEIKEIDGVDAVLAEYPNVMTVYGENEAEGTSTTFIGVPKNALKYFSVDDTSNDEQFLYLSESVRNTENFKDIKTVYIEAIRYVVDDNNLTTEPYTIERNLTGVDKIVETQILPPDISLIDEEGAKEIAMAATPPGKEPMITKIVAIVPDVSQMKSVSDKIQALHPDIYTKYDLKSTNDLPQFAVLIVTISLVLFVILFIISFFNIRSNIKQLLVTRIRDIALFDIFGVKTGSITFVFLMEFIFSGVIAFTLAISLTILILGIVNLGFNLDLVTPFIWHYVVIDILLTLVMVVITGYTEIKLTERKLYKNKVYKDVIR